MHAFLARARNLGEPWAAPHSLRHVQGARAYFEVSLLEELAVQNIVVVLEDLK